MDYKYIYEHYIHDTYIQDTRYKDNNKITKIIIIDY